MYIYMKGFTTGKPVSDNTLNAYTHTHRNARWRLCRKHSGVPRSRGSLPKTCTEQLQRRQRRGEELGPSPAALRPPQNTPPFTIPLPLFYSPRREAVTTRYIMFIPCPFGQGYASIFSQMNACYLGFHLSRLVPTYVLYNKTCAHV